LELLESRARFEFVTETAELGFWFCNLPFDELNWDAQVKRHFSLPPDARVTIDTFYASLHPDDRERTRQAMADSIANRKHYDVEYRTVSAQGVEKWIRAIGRTYYDAGGEPRHFDGVTLDITTRKLAEDALRDANALLADKASHLESLVQQRTAKLSETIQELEAFSYSIAHDMRAPLRSLQGFSRILLGDHSSQLDAECQHYLNRIAVAAGRMDSLIQDVLNYSRVARSEFPLDIVDVTQLVRGIIDTYPKMRPEEAEISVDGPLPSVYGNEAMLMQIISNLLGNAVKFVLPGVKPQVRIWAETRQEQVRFYVRDNGIGIPADQHEKIFGIFQRVSKDYEGTGIGLAIVKKAVARLGGTVGLESEPGRGSTFWIEVRKA
jgi:PAS domain S-box-containing protein